MMSHEPEITRVLPLERRFVSADGGVIFEPDERTVLDSVVPEYVAGLILRRSARKLSPAKWRRGASRWTRRARTRRSMIDDLKLQYNRARQSAITQEITEIVAGGSGLRQSNFHSKEGYSVLEEQAYWDSRSQVMGPVVDVRFEDGGLPPIHNALTVPITAIRTLTVEVCAAYRRQYRTLHRNGFHRRLAARRVPVTDIGTSESPFPSAERRLGAFSTFSARRWTI